MKKEFTISPEDAWDLIQRGEILETDSVGSFAGIGGVVSFSCGEGCCDDFWESKESFLQCHNGSKFRIQ